MEKYSRGRRGAPAKGVGRETGARVQIPPSPPEINTLIGVFIFLKLSAKSEYLIFRICVNFADGGMIILKR